MIIVLDTETTGTDPTQDCVVELAGAVIEGPLRYDTLVKPTRSIPPEASAVHHLTDADFNEAMPTLEEAWREMETKLGNEPPVILAAHNAPFDASFIGALSGGAPWLDTCRCARHIYPDCPNFSNQTLRYYLKLEPDLPRSLAPHRALYDVIVTADLLAQLLISHSIDELLKLQEQPVLLRICRFGKHRDVPWSEVPKDYLKWAAKQDFDEDTRYTIRYWLEH